MKKNLVSLLFAAITLSSSAMAAPLSSSITSNECNGDFSMKLAKYANTGTTEHYNAYSDVDFTRSTSWVVKMRVNVPTGYKIKTQSVYGYGDIIGTTGTTSEVLYGLSAKSADDKVYSGTSAVYKKNQKYSTGAAFIRGTGTTCGAPVDLIIRNDASTLKGTGKVKASYFTVYVDLIKC